MFYTTTLSRLFYLLYIYTWILLRDVRCSFSSIEEISRLISKGIPNIHLTILTGKNCVLLISAQEFTEIGIFKIALRWRDWHVLMWQSLQILNDFNTLTLKQIFWKSKTIFKKLEHHFLVESTKIENVIFVYKTTLSETSVKTNRMRSTKLNS